MSTINITLDRTKKNAQDLSVISRKIKKLEKQCDEIEGNLKGSVDSFLKVNTVIRRIMSELERESRITKEMSEKLLQIIQLYEKTEKEIQNEKIKEIDIDNIIKAAEQTIKGLLDNIKLLILGVWEKISAYAGDPVNMCNGNYLDKAVEIRFPNSLQLSFERYYSSIAGTSGVLGIGWRHNLEIHIEVNGPELILYSEAGIEKFVSDDSITFVSAYGNEDIIEKSDGVYRWMRENGRTYWFDDDGKLVKITDNNANAITLEYEEAKLKSASDQYGNKLFYIYEENGLLKSVTDSCGRVISFEYISMFLTKIESLAGKVYEYGYDEKGRLCTYYLPDGSVDFAIYYDDEGRVVKQEFADQAEMMYEYKDETVIYTDEMGNQTVYYHDEKGRHKKTVYADGSEECFAYDEANRSTLKIDRNGASICRAYDDNGNMVHAVDGCGNTIDYEYKDAKDPVVIRYPNGASVSAEYDDRGNMILLTDETGVRTEFTYNVYGQMTVLCREDGVSRYYEYDEKGNLCREIDENQCVISYLYDDYDNVCQETDANGNVTKYEYREDGKVVSVINAMGQKREISYDIFGNMEEVCDFDGLTERFSYDVRNRMESHTDKAGNVTEYEYDAGSRLIRILLSNGGVISNEYDVMGRLVKKILPDGEVISYSFDENGDQILVKKGEYERHFEYDRNHRVIKNYDDMGRKQELSYDFRGKVQQVVSEDGIEKRYEYDACGRCISVEDILGRKMEYSYDCWGNLVSVKDAAGRRVNYEYDAVGLLKKAVYPNGNWTEYVYDANRNLICKKQQDGYELFYQYDVLNRAVVIGDNQKHCISFEYNEAGEVCKKTDSLGNSTQYEYTENGKLRKVTDALGNVTVYSYDSMDSLETISGVIDEEEVCQLRYQRTYGGKIKTITNAKGQNRQYVYDSKGNMTSLIDEAGNYTSYEYDKNGNVRRIIYSDQKEAAFSYDSHGRMTEIADWSGKTRFSYDTVGRLVRSVNGRGKEMHYTWGSADELLSMKYPDREIVTYQYDDLKRRTGVSVGDWGVSYGYNENGRLEFKQFNNGVRESFCYNQSGQVSEHAFCYNDGIMRREQFEYDLMGNKSCKKLLDEKEQKLEDEKYDFDALNRLIKVTTLDGTETHMEYDARGNRVMKQFSSGMEQYSYNELNQLVQLVENCDGKVNTTNYTYDVCGNLLSEESQEEVKFFNYDARGRLVEMSGTKIPHGIYEYDSFSHRLSEKIDDNHHQYTKEYLIDYNHPFQRIVGIETNGKGENYLWGDELLGAFSGDDSMNNRYYSCDVMGSVTGVHDSRGLSGEWMLYDAFGNNAGGITNGSPFGFTGYLKENHSGYYYANARQYDPKVGRFMMRDKEDFIYIENPQSVNLYQYCLNNPVVFVDPSGNDCYIFYMPEWEHAAKNDQRQLAKQYGCSKEEVHLIPIENGQNLTNGWNSMGTVNGQEVDIDCVVILSHANPNVLGFENGEAFTKSDIAALENKDVEQLILYGCNSGHTDYSTSNVASTFSKKVNGAPVLASDGTVAPGLTFFGLTKRKYTSKADSIFNSYLRSGKRDNKGWLVYQYEDGKVNITEVGKKKMTVTDMNKELNKYVPSCNRRSS